MFEVDVKNVTEEGRTGGEDDQLGFGALIQFCDSPCLSVSNWTQPNLKIQYNQYNTIKEVQCKSTVSSFPPNLLTQTFVLFIKNFSEHETPWKHSINLFSPNLAFNQIDLNNTTHPQACAPPQPMLALRKQK